MHVYYVYMWRARSSWYIYFVLCILGTTISWLLTRVKCRGVTIQHAIPARCLPVWSHSHLQRSCFRKGVSLVEFTIRTVSCCWYDQICCHLRRQKSFLKRIVWVDACVLPPPRSRSPLACVQTTGCEPVQALVCNARALSHTLFADFIWKGF